MNGAEDGALLASHGLQDLHYILRHERVQAGRGFVTEQHWRIGEHLGHTHTQATISYRQITIIHKERQHQTQQDSSVTQPSNTKCRKAT